jgi:hypothetical protein
MRLTGIDSLQRGITNLLANWELVFVNLVQTFLVSLLIVAGTVPIVLAVGVGTLRALFGTDFNAGGARLEVVDDLITRAVETSGPLLLATLVALIVWTIALLVLAYFQAGIFGVLAEAERRAPIPTSTRETFRSFSLRQFRRSADELTWRFFWLINLFMALASVPLLVLGGVVMASAWLVTTESVGAAVATGCLGVVIVIVLSFVCSLWWQLAMAATASGPMRLWRAVGQGLRVLLRRLGALVVLVLLAIVVGITLAIVFVPVGIVVEVVVRDSFWGYISAQVVMTIIQSLFSAVLSVAFAAALIALVRGEISSEEMRVA